MSPALHSFGFLLFMLTRKVESVNFEQSSSQIVKEATEGLKINCSHDDSSLQTMLWYQHKQSSRSMSLIGYTVLQGNPVYEGQSGNKFLIKREDRTRGSLIILTVDSSNSAVYFCAARIRDITGGGEAYFGGGTKLTVLEKGREVTPPTNESVKVFGPSSFECRNLKDDERKKTLLCVVSGFYPDHVSVFWQVNGKNKTKGVATDNAAQWTDSSTEFYRITSRLRVPADDWNNPKNEFTCIISFFSGTDTTHYQNSIRGVEAQTKGVMTRDNYLRITQSAKLSYGIFIIKSTIYGAFVALVVWKLQGSTGKQNH